MIDVNEYLAEMLHENKLAALNVGVRRTRGAMVPFSFNAAAHRNRRCGVASGPGVGEAIAGAVADLELQEREAARS